MVPFGSESGLSDPNGLRWLDHAAIAVADIDAALPYYEETLGLKVVHDEIADDPGVRLCYLDAGNAYIQLVEPVRPGPVQQFLDEHGEGLHHICFAVDDIPRMLAAADDGNGVQVFMGGRERLACFLSGTPTGVLIELTETTPHGG